MAATTGRLKPGRFRSEPGKYYGTPKEIWGFRTRAQRASAEASARAFLQANRALFDLPQDLAGLETGRVIQSLGAYHVIFRQRHLKLRIRRGYVTVHLDRECRVYLAKSRVAPARLLPRAFKAVLGRDQAVRKARGALPRSGRAAGVKETERIWFPDKASLRPAWKVRLVRDRPREEWIVYVNAATGKILSRYDNLAEADGRALVFDPSPVTALGDHRPLLTAGGKARRPPQRTYREVALPGLRPEGFLDGPRVSTRPTSRRVKRADGRFLFRAHERGFEEAMVYYHVDQALRYLERLGFRGRRAIFREPVRANVNGSRDDNSWYSPWDRLLTFGTGAIDDAEDAETILHELGHAIQDAICPDFGQSTEAAAMGEGFGDYFAASFFASRKPPRYRACVMTWDGLMAGLEEGSNPPCLRRVDSKLRYRDFDHGRHADEHVNGLIWSAALWDIREALGRERADRLILESHFQQDGFTTFARGARAIVDADRNLERGRHVAALRRIFRRRGIDPA